MTTETRTTAEIAAVLKTLTWRMEAALVRGLAEGRCMDPDLRTRQALQRRGLIGLGERETFTDLGRQVAAALEGTDR
jgi:hypothetical protein